VAKKQKYYVVWQGIKPGIYLTWDDCQKQIKNVPSAKFKAFDTMAEAEYAFSSGHLPTATKKSASTGKKQGRDAIVHNSISVDAACSGNPGAMEYQGVETITGKKIFHQGPFPGGTNNIGEFLALVHALAYLKKQAKPETIIYSDSEIAIGWVRKGKSATKMVQNRENAPLFELISRAESWLAENKIGNKIIKWDTHSWGENPADFGRKK
jgi:ribonuclease HI